MLPSIAIALCTAAAAAVLLAGSGEPAPIPQSPASAMPSRGKPADEPVRLGLIEFNYSLYNAREIDLSIESLRQALAPRALEVKRYSAEALDREVKAGRIDFFVASAGFFWRMIPYGARSIATVVTASKPDPNFSDGAALIVPASSPARSVKDLKGLRLAASYPTAFIGYRVSMADLAARGYDCEKFFSRTTFTGSPHIHTLMHELDSGRADVTIIPACTWEEMPEIERRRFRLIGARKNTGMQCLSTTIAYPGHTFAVMNGVAPELAKAATAALLSMKSGPGQESWSIATDFTRVDQAYRLLKIGPYAYLRSPSAKRWVRENKTWLLLALLAIAGLALHAWRAEALVTRRTRELLEEEQARVRMSSELERMNQRMERMHKANIIGQLSSMISHELAQPLAAIRYYCEGARDLLADPVKNAALLSHCNEKVSSQADRAIAIINKVRSYAKATATREERVDLCRTLESVLQELKVKGISKVQVTRIMPTELPARGDPLELELLLWNLLKNATEAALKKPSPSIVIMSRENGGHAEIRIENTGPALDEDEMRRFTLPLASSKQGGLGLGVAIARSIAESSGGGISFTARSSGGLSALVWLPLWKAESIEKNRGRLLDERKGKKPGHRADC